ncbi:hypothetical protein [Enterococcus wangshanyuanii]|uniref:Lipoprotein n=1 Tax=Enterococcus wangshanyuanii TaxID=2005703 RepID=A0ABQ1NT64_9ENTE|nr:hypothetical protein [Enterococcus wangshanyuanii]GGC83336.1 hypothetical protein GCM10011573_11200 [Enterococcus wangshanyuanii]
MKKRVVKTIVIVVLLAVVSGCTNKEEKAKTAYKEGDYQEVVTLLGENKEKSEQSERIYLFSKAQLAFEKKHYQKVVDLLADKKLDDKVKDVYQLSNAQVNLKKKDYRAAVDSLEGIETKEAEAIKQISYYELYLPEISTRLMNNDADETYEQLQAAQNILNEEKMEKLTKVIEERINEKVKESDINNFYSLEKLATLLDKEEKNSLKKLAEFIGKTLSANEKNKFEAFLNRVWVRQDDTFKGLKLAIQISQENSFATILETSPEAPEFKVNDIKWRNIQYINSTTFRFEDLSTNKNYAEAVGMIDYSGETIEVHVTAQANAIGTSQLLVPVKE